MPTVSTENFSTFPHKITRDSTLSNAAFRVLHVGLSYSEDWVFHRDHLANTCGMSYRSIIRALEELRKTGHVTGGFRSHEMPLRFHNSPRNGACQNVTLQDETCQNVTKTCQIVTLQDEISGEQTCQNVTLQDETCQNVTKTCQIVTLQDEISGEQTCQNVTLQNGTCQIVTKNVPNCHPKNIKRITILEHPSSEVIGNAFIACEAKPENLTPTLSEGRDFSDVESSLNPIDEVHPFPEAEWRAFVTLWNDSGLPRYTALQPSALDVVNFRRLLSRYGRDGPQRLCEQATQSEWLKTQRWSLSYALREDLATKILDGQYRQNFTRNRKETPHDESRRTSKDIDLTRFGNWH